MVRLSISPGRRCAYMILGLLFTASALLAVMAALAAPGQADTWVACAVLTQAAAIARFLHIHPATDLEALPNQTGSHVQTNKATEAE